MFLEPTWVPKFIKHQPKKSGMFLIPFSPHFGFDFWSILAPKLAPKLIKKGSCYQDVEIVKIELSFTRELIFWRSERCNYDPKSIKYVSIIQSKQLLIFWSIFDRILIDLGGVLGVSERLGARLGDLRAPTGGAPAGLWITMNLLWISWCTGESLRVSDFSTQANDKSTFSRLGRSGGLWGHLGGVLVLHGEKLGSSWAKLGPSWAKLGQVGTMLGPSWLKFGCCWGILISSSGSCWPKNPPT